VPSVPPVGTQARSIEDVIRIIASIEVDKRGGWFLSIRSPWWRVGGSRLGWRGISPVADYTFMISCLGDRDVSFLLQSVDIFDLMNKNLERRTKSLIQEGGFDGQTRLL